MRSPPTDWPRSAASCICWCVTALLGGRPATPHLKKSCSRSFTLARSLTHAASSLSSPFCPPPSPSPRGGPQFLSVYLAASLATGVHTAAPTVPPFAAAYLLEYGFIAAISLWQVRSAFAAAYLLEYGFIAAISLWQVRSAFAARLHANRFIKKGGNPGAHTAPAGAACLSAIGLKKEETPDRALRPQVPHTRTAFWGPFITLISLAAAGCCDVGNPNVRPSAGRPAPLGVRARLGIRPWAVLGQSFAAGQHLKNHLRHHFRK